MISTPTVLILGAGASHPYGFSLGRELADQIIKYPKYSLSIAYFNIPSSEPSEPCEPILAFSLIQVANSIFI